MFRTPILPALAVCGLLSACSQPINNERVDWDHGARFGRVLELATPQMAQAEARACLGESALVRPSAAYVRVRYRTGRMHRIVIAAVPDGLALHAGDEVELWPADCGAGHMARVERVLAPVATHP